MKGLTERYLLGQKHNLQMFRDANILPSTGQESNIAQQKEKRKKEKKR